MAVVKTGIHPYPGFSFTARAFSQPLPEDDRHLHGPAEAFRS